MRTFFLLLVSICLSGCGDVGKVAAPPAMPAESQSLLQNAIRAQVADMQSKFVKGDLKGFIAYVHPEVIGRLGGPQKLREKLEPGLAELTKSIERFAIVDISEVVVENSGLAAFVSVETRYRYPDGGVLQKSYQIAFSNDLGKSWKFVDGQGRQAQEALFKSLFPHLTAKVPFPACRMEKL